MREKNRKPIASIKKLPQFTTMNVIDGQAGLISYFSLIFYSLTIDNILNIIVLLILAGVALNLTIGDNGIISRAINAREETKKSGDIEKIKMVLTEAQIGTNGYQELNQNNLQEALASEFEGRNVIASDNGDGTFTISCLDTLKDYTISGNNIEEEIDWNEAMANAVVPESQDEERNEGVIGIGTDGKPVDMDLWEYAFDNVTNGYALNNAKVLQNTEYNPNGTNTEVVVAAGYLGNIIDLVIDGNNEKTIEGTIPQYISTDGGINFVPVTSLYRTFEQNNEISIINKIPNTVVNMMCAFECCTSLKKVNLSGNVENINYAFNGATSLETIPNLGGNIKYMIGTFYKCNSLIYINFEVPKYVEDLTTTFSHCENLKEANLILGDNIKNMNMTFYYCENLEKGPDIIPKNVENLSQTFQGCVKMHGEMTIKANPTKYGNCFMLVGNADENNKLIIKDGENNRETLQDLIIKSDWQKKHVIGIWDL